MTFESNDDNVKIIKDRCNIIDIAKDYLSGVVMKGNRFFALSPFKQEKTPSFCINQEKQFYYCFATGNSGDVIKLVMIMENVDFQTALKILAQRVGVKLEEKKAKNKGDYDKKDFYDVYALAAAFFHTNLLKKSVPHLQNYLEKRKLEKQEIEEFQIGFALNSWNSLYKYLKEKGYQDKFLLKAGLIKQKEKSVYDAFRNRLIFPIYNELGQIIAFSARILDEKSKEAKYINSQESILFSKSNTLYGLHIARKFCTKQEKNALILCEGQIDVISCHKAGFKNAISSQGTSFTELHAKKISRYTENLLIAFDNDEAGQGSIVKSLQHLFPLEIIPQVIPLKEGDDPDSILNREGKEGLIEIFSKKISILDFLIDYYSKKEDKETPKGKLKIIKNCLAQFSYLSNKILQKSYIQELANFFELTYQELLSEFHKIKGTKKFTEEKVNEKEEVFYPQELSKLEIYLYDLVVNDEELAYKFIEDEASAILLNNKNINKLLHLAISEISLSNWENLLPNVEKNPLFKEFPKLASKHFKSDFEFYNQENLEKSNDKINSLKDTTREVFKDCLFKIKEDCYKKEMTKIQLEMKKNPSNDKLFEQFCAIDKKFRDLTK